MAPFVTRAALRSPSSSSSSDTVFDRMRITVGPVESRVSRRPSTSTTGGLEMIADDEDDRSEIAQILSPFDQKYPVSSVEVCSGVNCGEAGCLARDNKPVCLCIYSPKPWPPPDENLRCNRSVVNPISPGSFPQPPFPGFPWPIQAEGRGHHSSVASNLFDRMSALSDSDSGGGGFAGSPVGGGGGAALPAASVGGAASVLVVLAVVIVLILRRRRPCFHTNIDAKKQKDGTREGGGGGGEGSEGGGGGGGGEVGDGEGGASPVVWLQRYDGGRVFDRLLIVSSNEAYYRRDFDDAVLVQTKLIPIGDLKLEKEIGEGTFGKVYKGVVTSGVDESDVTDVAVKILKEEVSSELRNDFRREVETMSSFDHENILKLLGVVFTDFESPYMVFEFMEYGDLTDILRRNDPSLETTTRSFELKPIVRGMIYLSSRRFVHRDLASRNCLVGSGFVIKIADFGMSRDLYTCDYYKVSGNRLLPVRWMAPESIKYGRYGIETDVWSYGIVLWEVFAYGRQPYYGHSNEEAIRFIEEGILLQKPSGCSDTVYHVMLGCWRRDSRERFTFERIHRHLVEYDVNKRL